VKLNILGNNGCLSDTLRQEVVVGSDPFARIKWSPDPVCENAPLQLRDSSLVKYGTVNQWNWNVGGVTFTTRDPVIPGGLPAGPNRVSLNVRTLEGCISPVETVQVNVLPLPVVDLSVGPKDICAGGTTTLTGTNRTPSMQMDRWIWSLGDGRTDSSGQVLSPSYADPGIYRVTLQGRASNGCYAVLKSDSVHVFTTNAFAGNDTTIAAGLPFRLNGTGGVSYSWSPPFGLSDPNIADPIATLDKETEFELTATSPAGCSTTDKIRIRVFKGPEIYVPTAFTPNGDGLNDVLKVLPIGVNLTYFRVFDSWGNLVFSTTDYRSGWDGTQRNRPMPSGVYVWMTAGTESGGKTIFKKGTLQLMR
jgi:gliding motility-associated-like protein